MEWTSQLTLHTDSVEYYRKDDIESLASKHELEHFNWFMFGQTVITLDESTGILLGDFNRWVKMYNSNTKLEKEARKTRHLNIIMSQYE